MNVIIVGLIRSFHTLSLGITLSPQRLACTYSTTSYADTIRAQRKVPTVSMRAKRRRESFKGILPSDPVYHVSYLEKNTSHLSFSLIESINKNC